MKYLYNIYQLFVALPVTVLITIITAIEVGVGCAIGDGHFWLIQEYGMKLGKDLFGLMVMVLLGLSGKRVEVPISMRHGLIIYTYS